MTVEEIRGQQPISLDNHIQVTCCGSGQFVYLKDAWDLCCCLNFVYRSLFLSRLYPCSMFPAQPPPHTAARTTPAKCICSHSYKVGPQLPFRQPGILSLPFPSPITDFILSSVSMCPSPGRATLPKEPHPVSQIQLLVPHFSQFILRGIRMIHSKQFHSDMTWSEMQEPKRQQ